jgi:Ca-activated chloride channel family protein
MTRRVVPEDFKEKKMKNPIRVIFVPALWLTFALFSITGCVTSEPGAVLYSDLPSGPAQSGQQTQKLTEEAIMYLIEKGDAAYDSGRYETAKDHYYEALFAMPDPDAYILVAYGACLAYLRSYENAITIFNMALQKDPNNQDARNNIALCRQYIARQTEAQRQFELQQQRQQQENFQNLIGSLNELAKLAESQQKGGNTSQSAAVASSNTGNKSSATSVKKNDVDKAGMQRNYNTRAKAAEDIYFQLQRAEINNESKSTIDRLSDSLKSHQRNLKSYREECNRKGADIKASLYETKWP